MAVAIFAIVAIALCAGLFVRAIFHVVWGLWDETKRLVPTGQPSGTARVRTAWLDLEPQRKAATVVAVVIGVLSAWPLLSLAFIDPRTDAYLYAPIDVWRWNLMFGGLVVSGALVVVGTFGRSLRRRPQPHSSEPQQESRVAMKRVQAVHIKPKVGERITYADIELRDDGQHLFVSRDSQPLARLALDEIDGYHVVE
jgi:hypothetical protein